MVVADDGTLCEPGDGRIGMLGVGGPIPIGYYKDPEKTAATFRSVGGRHYSIPGDYARIEPDGIVTLLGRGSACINTGGEKVYPEEVELVLRSHPSVFDCVVVGVADERWGEMVVALVEPSNGDDFDEDAVAAHCRELIAAYKCPKRFVVLESLGRSPAGKADYAHLRRLATPKRDACHDEADEVAQCQQRETRRWHIAERTEVGPGGRPRPRRRGRAAPRRARGRRVAGGPRARRAVHPARRGRGAYRRAREGPPHRRDLPLGRSFGARRSSSARRASTP